MKLTYNGIQILNVHTLQVSRQPVRSMDNMEFISIAQTLDITGVINPGATSANSSGVQTPGFAPVLTDVAIRHYLSEERKQLTYSDELGNVLLSSPPAGNTVDAGGGPFPELFSLTQISGSKTFLCRFRVTTFLAECPGENTTSPLALTTNRYTCTHAIGEDHRPVIHWQGFAQFRFDAMEDVAAIPDFFRRQIVPPCPSSFQRGPMSVQVSSVGNQLVWEVTDVFKDVTLGDSTTSKHPDVLTFNAEYTQVTQQSKEAITPSGMLRASFQGTAVGRPLALRANLFLFLIRLALNKISFPVGPVDAQNNTITTSIAIREKIETPTVGLMIEVSMPAAQVANQGIGGMRSEFWFGPQGQQYQLVNPEFDNQNQRCPDLGADNNTRSPAYLGYAVASALKQPCAQVSPVKPDQGSATVYPSDPGPNYTYPINPSVNDNTPPPYRTKYSTTNYDGGNFTTYRIDMRYDGDEQTIMVPVASPASDSAFIYSNGNFITPGPQGPEFIVLASPMSTCTVEFEATRQVSPPELPKSSDPNFVLLKQMIQLTNITYMPDGVCPVYHIEGRQEYGLREAIKLGGNYAFPVSPAFTDVFGDIGITGDNWADGLIDFADGSQSPSAGGSTGGNGLALANGNNA
jgi:hypothetical protein